MNKDVDGGRLDDSLTNIQWLGKMSSSTLESGSAKGTSSQENQEPNSQTQVGCSSPEVKHLYDNQSFIFSFSFS